MRCAPVVFAVALVVAAGCAEERYGAVATTWDQASSAPAAPAEHAVQRPKVTAKDVATSSKGAAECLVRAKEYYSKDPRASEALVVECAKRDDFVDLDGLLRGPWIKDLRASEPFQLLVAEVIAHRGGFVEQDTKTARIAGVALNDYQTAMSTGSKAIGKLVIVRGAVESTAHEKWGTGKSLVARVAESSWADEGAEDTGKTVPVREAAEDTGRVVFARIEKVESRFTRDRNVIVAMRLEGPRKYQHDDEEVTTLVGVAVGIYDTGNKLRQ